MILITDALTEKENAATFARKARRSKNGKWVYANAFVCNREH